MWSSSSYTPVCPSQYLLGGFEFRAVVCVVVEDVSETISHAHSRKLYIFYNFKLAVGRFDIGNVSEGVAWYSIIALLYLN